MAKRTGLRMHLGLVGTFALGVLTTLASTASGQGSGSGKLIVPYPPGSGPDITSRLVTEQIARSQNFSFVLENRPGGGTVTGTEVAMRAPADGNTVLLVANSFVVNPVLGRGRYDVAKDFEPVCQIASTPIVLVVGNDAPYRSLKDWVEAARQNPGKLTVAGAPASSLHIAFEVIKLASKIDVPFVPFPGTAPAVTALLGGHVTAVTADYPTVVEHLRAGRLRGLVTATPARIPGLPDVPTITETGIARHQDSTFYGIVAPSGTPAPVLSRLAAWFGAAMSAPEVVAKLSPLGLFPDTKCGDQFGSYLRDLVSNYGKVIREAKIEMPK